ncbi:hypothetical protein GCM10025859_06420 [Alicyclobacillus fastidiosus]|nr:hypothetical protein GCM10025859_06420 [Alicyclobacillus fastidiosus]
MEASAATIAGQTDSSASGTSQTVQNISTESIQAHASVNDLGRPSTPGTINNTTIPVGSTWDDTSGNPIQAHGGGILKQGGWYYWVGQDMSNNSSDTTAINLYKSKDLLNWEFVSTILSSTTNPGYTTDSTPGLIDPTTDEYDIERPKLLYNKSTGEYVLWAHWEDGRDYDASHLLVAESSSVSGHYTILHNFRPGAGQIVGDGPDPTYTGTDGNYGYSSRDFNVYEDPSTGDAYLISAENSSTMRLYKLTDNYTNVDWQDSYPLLSGDRREAPAMIKVDGVYYLISSLQSGWDPNQAMYTYTTNINNPNSWAPLQPLGNNTTFYSQPTDILEVNSASRNPQYIYMGDRNDPNALGSSTYVWLPLNIDSTTHTMSMSYTPWWSLASANGLGRPGVPSAPIKNGIDINGFILPNVSLVSQGKPVEGQDNVVPGHPLSYIDDGNYFEAGDPVTADTWSPNTQYYEQNKVPWSVTIDLQQVYDLSRVDLSWKQFNGSESYYDYTIEGSNNDSDWTLLADETQNKTVGFTSDMLQGKYRYVKLTVTGVFNSHNGSSTASWENGLLEMQVYANNLPQPITPLPVPSTPEGTYTTDQTITLSDPVKGARIYYTTDGTDPTNKSTPYTGPITLSRGDASTNNILLKAVACAPGMEFSGVTMQDYTLVDPNNIVSVLSPTEFAVTAAEGTAGLPTTLKAVNAAGNTIDNAPVAWNTSGLTFNPYTQVSVTGTMAGGYQVNATVDVVNADTIYFIHGQAGSDDSFFDAAKALLGNQLMNTVPDQAYDGNWGYTGTIGTDIGYKYSGPGIYGSGWWAYANKSIDYTLHLGPGNYTLISGYQEWWGATRSMTFSATDPSGNVLASVSFTTNSNTTATQEKIQFTLDQSEDVNVSVSKTGAPNNGSDAVMAWLAAEETPLTTAAT